MPKQDSNLGSHGRLIHICRPAERHRSFIQHVNVQAKSANKNILTSKKKNRKVISLPNAPLESTTKIKPSTEDYNVKHLKGNSNSIDKYNFSKAFIIANVINTL